ncbi:zinc ABC transporter permease [Candidatus Magnetoovum chiemensis]|nr:zinc ABC transporter permease [Candidatus Magnetoovum chiemensis]
MSQQQIEIQLIAVIVAIACALPGVFLVLRKTAMLSDAISHSILLGIVSAFLITKNITSPFLVIGAALTGVLTVALVEVLSKSKIVKEDASIGLIFPLLFSIGVILIARNADKVHLDTDAVLLGEIAFAPFNRFYLFNIDIGPKAVYVMGGILIINLAFISVFYKELKLAAFDSALAKTLGFSPQFIHYGLMTLVSITAVGAFDSVGSVLVVALMIGPPACAYLIVDSLFLMLIISCACAVISSIAGYWSADLFDVSIAGSMATVIGVLFFLVFLFTPHRGIVSLLHRRNMQKWNFYHSMLLVHIANHEGLDEETRENHVRDIYRHLKWDRIFAARIIKLAQNRSAIYIEGDIAKLTPSGKKEVESVMIG